MILRLFAWILLLGSLAVAGGWTALKGIRRLFGPALEERRQRKLGRVNAARVCFVCGRKVDPKVDFYDDKSGWHHPRCLNNLLGT